MLTPKIKVLVIMKTFNFSILLAVFAFFSFSSLAQDKSKYQAYTIHEDHIKPSMVMEYEKLAAEFKELMEKHNVQNADYLAVSNDEFVISYVSPIDNMADLDKNFMEGITDQAAKDRLMDIFSSMDKCYDTLGDHILILDNELSYMPDGMSQTQEGMDYRTWYKYYVTPENRDAFIEKAKAFKDFKASKNSKRHYRVYRSGFGVSDAYFLVAISAKDAEQNAQARKADKELVGPDRKQYILDILKYASRFEVKNGWIRRDLSYMASK